MASYSIVWLDIDRQRVRADDIVQNVRAAYNHIRQSIKEGAFDRASKIDSIELYDNADWTLIDSWISHEIKNRINPCPVCIGSGDYPGSYGNAPCPSCLGSGCEGQTLMQQIERTWTRNYTDREDEPVDERKFAFFDELDEEE